MANPQNQNATNEHPGPAGSSGESAQTSPDETSAAEIEQLRIDLKEAGDRVLRAQADLDNYRKRASRELEEERRFANLPLLRELLPVTDNIQRAIAAAEKQGGSATLLDGIKMVAQSLSLVLARHDCVQIEALHKPFDPTFHQAISQQPSPDFPPNTVLLVAQEGYTLYGRVVRPAQVIVSMGPPAGVAD